MAIDVKKKLKKERNRSFLAKDFNAFRAELLNYARTYFPDKIQDFSEASLGGLFLDMASMVGDTMSFYLDHQFGELNPLTAVESSNIVNHLRNAGVKIVGASPASVRVNFYIVVPSTRISSGKYVPKTSALPVIRQGTVLRSDADLQFNLTEDLDFGALDSDGNLRATVLTKTTNTDGTPATYIMIRQGLCVSGAETTEAFTIPNTHKPFRELVLMNDSVSDIISVRDTEGNEYYQVETLSQDTVFKGVLNMGPDGVLVPMNLEISSAPYRFTAKFSPITRLTKIRFGSGNTDSLDDDIIPDPSELSLQLYGKTTFSRFSIDPNALLETHTLGLAPKNTTVTVVYRHGGGLSHNAASESIRFISDLKLEFRRAPSITDAAFVRESIDVKNPGPARGGDRAPTLDELRAQVPSAKQMQSRIVSKQDLISRIYTLPNRFGRVYRAGIRQNPTNPLSTQLFVASRNEDGDLDICPDSLKKNLSLYLNEFRLISDAMDILDAQIINFGVKFGILSTPGSNKTTLIQTVITRLSDVLHIKNFQIDQPVLLDDLVNVIINTPGVVSLINLEVSPINGTISGRKYSSATFNFKNATKNRMIVGPPGSIFELKFPDHDIVGTSS